MFLRIFLKPFASCTDITSTRCNITDRLSLNARSGLRQGCPLSAIIFIIATNAIIRFLHSSLNPLSTIRLLADGTALVLYAIWAEGHILAQGFQLVEVIAWLVLNARKCTIIPVWVGDYNSIMDTLAGNIPFCWGQFSVQGCGKYLGVQIGPTAGDTHTHTSWHNCMNIFCKRVDMIELWPTVDHSYYWPLTLLVWLLRFSVF